MEEDNPVNVENEMACANECQKTDGCTHFTFTGVECWKKSGSVTKEDMVPTDFDHYICGIVKRSSKLFFL